MKRIMSFFVIVSCLVAFSTSAYSMNIIGKWKKVDSSETMQILDKKVGIVMDLRNGRAVKFNYQFMNNELISFETARSSQVQKIKYENGQLFISDVNGANLEVFTKYDDASLDDMIKTDFQHYLDRNFPGLCKVKSFIKDDTGKYVARVVILKNMAKAFSTSGTHISGLGGGFMQKSPFVWIIPAGKKGAYNSSGMWQAYSPDVATGDVFQVSFAGYF